MVGYVFMSYSRKDEQSMRRIAGSLRAQGLKVWVDDEKLIPGTPVWEEEVERGIMNASAIVVILSPDSKSSEWVRREIALADQHGKRVFPVLVRGDENTSISLRLINRQYVDLREQQDMGLKNLGETLSFYINDVLTQKTGTNQQTGKPLPGGTKHDVHSKERIMDPQPSGIKSRRSNRRASQKTDSQPRESSSRGNIFGWLDGGKGEAKKLVQLLADTKKRDQAGKDLIRLGDPAIPVLLEAIQTRDENMVPVYQQVLARIPSASPALINVLESGHPIMRARVADILGVRRDKDSVHALLESLKGEYYTVRARAAIALGRIGDKNTIAPLLSALKDPEDEVRIGACLGLGFFKDPSTFEDVANVLLDDPKIEVRQAAAKALGNTNHHDALPFLMEALRDSYWWYEREVAAGDLLDAIEKMGPIAVDPLVEALKDKEGAVRKFAAILLGRIRDVRAIEPLGMALYDLHHDVGEVAAKALVNFGTDSFEILVEALDHPEMWIRIHSVDVLPIVKDPRIGAILSEMLKDPEREVKKHVIEALGALRDPQTRSALQAIASDRSDRELHALAKKYMEKL